MDGRTSVWLMTASLAIGCAGCVTSQSQNTEKSASPPSSAVHEEAPKPKKDDGPKRFPQATTEVKVGKLKEADADSEACRKNPELQARLRDEARMAYQQAIKLDPNNLDASRCLAKLYAKMGDYERAQDIYKKALAKNPKDGALWYDFGLCHNRRKDFNESVRCFNEALKLDPENRTYLKTLGFTLAYCGQIDQGLTCLVRAQGAALAHYNIARVLLQRDQHSQAKQYLQIALRENSQLEEAREMLASLEGPTVVHAVLGAPIE